jgi:hypothetical protein
MVSYRRNGIYRCIIVAAFGLVLIGTGEPPKQAAKPEQTKAVKPEPQRSPTVATNTTKPVEAIKRAKQQEPCGPRRYRGDDDLCAQWKAADSASDAAQWAWWQTVFSALGIVGLLLSLYYTRKAVLAAEDATKDADSALEIANKNAAAAIELAQATKDSVENTKALVAATAANSRPWIKIDVRPTGPLICKDGALSGTFGITVKCLGKMPALKVITWIEMNSQAADGPLVAGLCIDELRYKLDTAIIGNLPMGNEVFPEESFVQSRFGANAATAKVRDGEIYPVIAVGASYKWAGGVSETLMSYWLMDRESQRMGFPNGDWEVPADRIEIRRDGVHSIT